MPSWCNGSILLGAAVLSVCVALAVMEPDIKVKKPFGPKMCERFCNQTAGCSSFIYTTFDLSCVLTNVASPKQNPERRIHLTNATKNKERMHGENATNRVEGGKIFGTRRHRIQCRPILSSHPACPSKEEIKGRMTRLLMLLGTERGRQVYPGNNFVAGKPFYYKDIVGQINAVAYIPSQRKFVVSTARPNYFFFAPIGEDKRIFIKTEYQVLAISIDRYAYMKVKSSKLGVHVRHVSMQIKDPEVLRRSIGFMFKYDKMCDWGRPGGLVAYKRSMIYVLCVSSKILQYTYRGGPKGFKVLVSIDGSFGIKGQDLHIHGDILYYQNESGYLCKLSLSDTSSKSCPFKIPCMKNMLTVGDMLYMTECSVEGNLLAVNMADKGAVTKINIGYKQEKVKVTLCLITNSPSSHGTVKMKNLDCTQFIGKNLTRETVILS